MQHIQFLEIGIKSTLKHKRALKQFLLELIKKEQKQAVLIQINFCTDDFLLSLNKKYLNHDFYTDTLTFPFSGNVTEASGEIFISIDRIAENVKKFKTLYQTELARVIIHSCLHLCGYKDKPKKEEAKMLIKQEEYVTQWLFHVKH